MSVIMMGAIAEFIYVRDNMPITQIKNVRSWRLCKFYVGTFYYSAKTLNPGILSL